MNIREHNVRPSVCQKLNQNKQMEYLAKKYSNMKKKYRAGNVMKFEEDIILLKIHGSKVKHGYIIS